MARPIPGRILRHTVRVSVCVGTDVYQNQQFDEYTVNRVHLQPTSEIRKTTANTDAQLKSVLFVDVRRSYPRLDWPGLLTTAHERGGDLYVTADGVRYTVLSVDALRDENDRPHHYEIGLV